ncbi:hypothetical protein WDL1P1_00309 (plasmid) [Variovorax sp. WDL1]|nr:hypothetical protein CHC06_05887 [Variovorax sp. B2]PNG51137.1 hypothetical protein CHC07_05793 [Variovorax sp. B4]VTU42565.1 hypothetical protein SRS16P1_00301 [Variovorax sp. SRS16]VTU42589.1 hypothetical protein E5P1_00299 [Variovorax sp. PBL-E5]VTU43934.1 hypothetical protein H6P1_00630 [Variovorax sp. PBL-H6]VTV17343.1 hypothetical protein WDL1P1_00309 [Variovorax sp. WDL1]
MRFLKASAIVATALVLHGCAISSKPIPGPNGRTAYTVKCGSAVLHACYEEAAKLCPQGYSLVDRQDGPNGIVTPMGAGATFVRGPNSMFIECKS